MLRIGAVRTANRGCGSLSFLLPRRSVMKKAVVKHVEGESKFRISFGVSHSQLNRHFNLTRSLDESLSSFVLRLQSNIEREIHKKKKKTKSCQAQPEPNEQTDDRSVYFKRHGLPIDVLPDTPVSQVLFDDSLVMVIMGADYHIAVNPPIVENATLPDCVMAGYLVYPMKLSLLFADRSQSSFEWFVGHPDGTDWQRRHQGFYFTPSQDDVGLFLRLLITPRLDVACGQPMELTSKAAVSSGPAETCPFEERHLFTAQPLQNDQFRVMSYNLLADLYADSDFSRAKLHPQCPDYALHIGYRKLLLLKEILGYHCDVMCFQEVDQKIHQRDLGPVLRDFGYDGVHTLKGGKVSEGLACFWRSSRYQLVGQERRIELSQAVLHQDQYADVRCALSNNEQLLNSFQKRTTVLQIVVLHCLDHSGHGLIVANTHLYFRPDADHIRLLQSYVCLREISAVLQAQSQQRPDMKYAVLFCGDFNSTPPFGVLQLVRNGHITQEHPDWASCPDEEVKHLAVSHPLPLESACGTPPFTTYTIAFKDCLDYIFYMKDVLQVNQVVPLPSEDTLAPYQGLPNAVCPSDHLALVADLSWS